MEGRIRLRCSVEVDCNCVGFVMQCFNNLPLQDDKGDASHGGNGSCLSGYLGGNFRIRQSVVLCYGLSLSPTTS
ncbi:hypothetical protein V6N12_002679 [Hibiscus sabdariffa]|uniref:Uncharacterized protein n=1 Tax=Hibiscus sabdariffa TaxID=183260 RepID=A0ABR2EBT1_9ROSI